MKREVFVQEVRDSLSLLTVPVQPGRGGVELLSPLLLYGGRYRHVFVLGMAEGILPAPVKDDPVLDFHERKRLAQKGLRLEQAAEAARREHVSFYSLLQSAGETLTLSYPRLLGTHEALPSPYFSMLDLQPAEPPLFPAASLEEARRMCLRHDVTLDDPVLPRARHAWNVERRRELAEHYDEYDGIINHPLDSSQQVFSASQLTILGQCPFRWFATYLLGLGEPDEAETDLSPSLQGILYHKILELAVAWARDAGDLRQAVLNRLEEAFLQAERELRFPPIPAWPARRSEHLALLRQAVLGADFLRDGAEVLATETRFKGEWNGLAVTGIVDRVDGTAKGLLLVDYKTRSTRPAGAKDQEGKLTLDVQLPLYLQAATPALYPGEQAREAYYYSLTKGEMLRAQVDEAGLERLVQEVKQRLQDGHYPVQPDPKMEVCKTCACDPVCRRGSRLIRKGVPYDPDA